MERGEKGLKLATWEVTQGPQAHPHSTSRIAPPTHTFPSATSPNNHSPHGGGWGHRYVERPPRAKLESPLDGDAHGGAARRTTGASLINPNRIPHKAPLHSTPTER
jgi:hypothetical protein